MCIIIRIYQTSWTWKWKYPKKSFLKQQAEYLLKAHTLQSHKTWQLFPPPPCMLPGMRSERDWLRGMKGSWFCVRPRLTSHVHHLPGEENKILQPEQNWYRTHRQMALQLYNMRSEDWLEELIGWYLQCGARLIPRSDQRMGVTSYPGLKCSQ